MRVHQLAKELGYTNSQEFIKKLAEMGISISSHLKGLTDKEVAEIKDKMKNVKKEEKSSKKNQETKRKENEGKVNLNIGSNPPEKNSWKENKNHHNKENRNSEMANRDSKGSHQNRENRDVKNRNRNFQNRENKEAKGSETGNKENRNRDNRDNRESNKGYHKENRSSHLNQPQNKEKEGKSFDRNFNRRYNEGQNRDSQRDGSNKERDRERNRNFQNKDNKDGKSFHGRDTQRDGKPSFDRDNRRGSQGREGQKDGRSHFDRNKEDFKDGRSFNKNKKESKTDTVAPAPIAEKPKTNVKGKGKFDKKKYENDRKQKEEERKLRELRSDFKKDDRKKKNKKKHEKVVKDEIVRIEGESIGMITIGEEIVIKELAEKLGVNVSDIIKKFFMQGKMLTANAILSFEEAEEVALDYEVIVEKEEVVEISYGEKYHLEIEDREQDLVTRAPVITIMGHVDHGKTSLLDALRHTNVIEGEAGGITQRIGAYQVKWNGQRVTFIDTPGHEAFTEMRARGANITDISILIVAADDGVKPQTVEAISHAKEAGVPIIVAINKIDKPGADPMKVRTELTEYGLISPDWGGNTEFVEISAKQKINLEELLETILITAELLELKANPRKRAKAVVVESRLDPKMGAVADILIQEGELKIGDIFVAGESHGRVRSMLDDRGRKVERAGLSKPVEITGFSSVPNAGDILYAVNNDKQAKKIVEDFIKEKKVNEQNKKKHISLESLSQELEEQQLKELKCIIRADSKGSVEALKESLLKLNNEKVMISIIQASAGAVTEGDVKLAEASNAIIIAFNVRPTTPARNEAEKTGVEIRNYNVIYHVTEEIEKAMTGMLDPEYKEVYFGRIEVKQVFKITNVGNIAGAIVVDGKVNKTSKIRVIRDGIIIYNGELESLKRFKDDAKEVVVGQECGIGIKDFNDIKEGDIIESYILEEIPR